MNRNLYNDLSGPIKKKRVERETRKRKELEKRNTKNIY